MWNVTVSQEYLDRVHPPVTWPELAYAFEAGLIHPSVVTSYAKRRVSCGDSSDQEGVIASASIEDRILTLVVDVASRYGEIDLSEAQCRWGMILAGWFYEKRSECVDLLGLVESLYSALDYPDCLAPFVRYMPSVGPDLGSVAENENQMIVSLGRSVAVFVTTKPSGTEPN